jgi:uncharacterized protein YgiM (DUF1202 family)
LNALIRHKALAIVVIAGVAAVIIITWRVVAMRQRADDALQEISEVAALPEISISASDEVALEAAAAEAEEEEREAEELAEELAELNAPVNPPVTKVAILENSAGSLNVRSSPSISAEIINRVLSGEAYQYIAEEPDWYQIILADQTTGWVSKQFVKVIE